MSMADIKAYVESHITAAEDDIKAKWAEVVAWVENKQANDAAIAKAEAERVAAEVADLQAKGYTVTAPAAVDAPVPTDTPAAS